MRFKTLVCSLLAAALLVATSQYLAHFHIPQADPAHVDQAHGVQELCSLCLQFDRLPAPPTAQLVPRPYFHLIATVQAERLERLALDTAQLWPPSRGPPHLAC